MPLTLKFDHNDSSRVNTCPKFVSACGGIPPYVFTSTKGTVTQIGTSQARIDAPANLGASKFPGTPAFGRVAKYKTTLCFSDCVYEDYGCNGAIIHACPGTGFGATACLQTIFPGAECFVQFPIDLAVSFNYQSCIDTCSGGPCIQPNVPCTYGLYTFGGYCDLRTQSMKDGGCNPCPISLMGGIVTVTDFTGVAASRTMTG